MQISRRFFLSGITAAAAVPGVLASTKAAIDPDLTVLVSDVHVPGDGTQPTYQLQKFRRTVAEILKLNPLPARVIAMGDIAYLYGRLADYRTSAKEFKLLSDAGIQVTLCMGNHDRRSTFLEVYPEYAKTTKVPGRIVSVVDAGKVDFLLLDGLQGTDDRPQNEMGPGGGKLDPAQQEWLRAELPKWKKPVFVCSHFPLKELNVGKQSLTHLLYATSQVAGYIHGHDHRWYKLHPIVGWQNSRLVRSLCLPSTGHWGDIGYTTFKTSKTEAVATLRQFEYFFPSPKAQRPEDQELWNRITAENQHQTCTFMLPRQG